ncbi:MAG: glycosyltransferase family 4 protein [Candidatus Pacearchaeota archaeon]|jgi:glycosyltransferase involved in cell wall biosynthesis
MKKRILMLAWKDMFHPKKGGAEVVTDIYLKSLVKSGHKVTLFTAKYKCSKSNEKYNGYNIIRSGNSLGVYLKGLLYAKKNENKFDIIIDQVNTVPFFTPLLIKKNKRVAFFHQLCLNIWFYEMPFPISLIGNLSERIYLKLYSNTKTFTVSNSSKQDLVKYAWMNPNNIKVLENQIDFKPLTASKTKQNYVIFVGRLTKSKRVDDCIKALSRIKNKQTKLVIVGNGSQKYQDYLEKLTNKLNLTPRVIFTKNIDNKQRNKLMQEALAILVTSVKEGWGLIVTEANANRTIAITYNIDGLRDANTNKTGIITEKNTPIELAKEIDFIIANPELRKSKETIALEFAKEHNDWNKNCKELETWIKQ